MANESTTTTLNDLLPSIVAEALFVAQEQSIMRGLVKNFSLPYGSGTTVTVPIYPVQTAAGLTEGTDLANTAISTGGATLTVTESGIMTTVTDLARRASASNVITDVGRLFGNAIAKKIDVDLMTLFAGFSTIQGSATTEISVSEVFAAVAKLKALGVGPEGLALVVHPYVAYDLKDEINTAAYAGGDAQNEAMRSGYLGSLAGVPMYESGNVPITTGDSVGGLFHRDALGLAMLQDIGIEVQRDASLRADELVATATYGVGELYDSYGIAMSFDSTLADA